MSAIELPHPRAAAALAAARFGLSLTEARRFAAQTFADACEQARAGRQIRIASGAGEDPSLDIYAAGLPGFGAAAWWSRELFFDGDRPAEVCPEVIDITGRGRILAYGPLLALPGGDWRLSLRFELCADAARHCWRIEFAAGEALSQREVRPTGPGFYEVDTDASWTGVALAEGRLWVAEPAFHGALRLHGARIEWAGA